MNHRDRIDTIITGELPDRPAVSFWRHHYRQEVKPEDLAEITVAFQREYDWDLVKVNPRSMYFSEDWGNRYRFFDEDHRKPELTAHRIRSAADWGRLEPLD